MNIKYATNRGSIAVIVVGLVGACRGEPPPAPVPAKPLPVEDTSELDAGSEAGVSSQTSAVDEETSSTETPDAAPEAGHTRPHANPSDAAADAGRRVKLAADAGDGGAADAGDAGIGHEAHQCSSLGSEEPGELGLCAEKFEDWCESSQVVSDCEERAVSRDEGVFAAYLDCLDEAFESSDLCEGDEAGRIAAVVACASTADATACVEHNVACEVYEGCEAYTVEECDANLARFNERYVRYGSPYFECPIPPTLVLGD